MQYIALTGTSIACKLNYFFILSQLARNKQNHPHLPQWVGPGHIQHTLKLEPIQSATTFQQLQRIHLYINSHTHTHINMGHLYERLAKCLMRHFAFQESLPRLSPAQLSSSKSTKLPQVSFITGSTGGLWETSTTKTSQPVKMNTSLSQTPHSGASAMLTGTSTTEYIAVSDAL